MNKRTLLLASLLVGISSAAMAQGIQTYSVYDINHDQKTDVGDVILGTQYAPVQGENVPQVVDADAINSLLETINKKLNKLERMNQKLDQLLTPETPEPDPDPEPEPEPELNANGHRYVDLGVKVDGKTIYWAACNLGTDDEFGYGDYYAWAETKPYHAKGHATDNPCHDWQQQAGRTITGYNAESYKYAEYVDGQLKNSKYHTTDDLVELGLEDDAARQSWGGDWRMPTCFEFEQLFAQCNVSTISNGDAIGTEEIGLLIQKKDDEETYIILPLQGWRDDIMLRDNVLAGLYWTSTYDGFESFPLVYGYYLGTSDESTEVPQLTYMEMYNGLPIRPVIVEP